MFQWVNRILDKIGSPELDWVQVEVTSQCNAACSYCPQPLIGHKQHMPFELFKKLLPNIGYTDLVYLQGWGEPLLNPDLFSMIRACKATGKRVGFTTNGMLLNNETIQRMIDLETDIISISLTGTHPATHNRIRKGTDLTKIIKNLELLQEIKKEKNIQHPVIHLAYLMLASNLHELQEVVGLAKRLGVEQIVCSHLSLILHEPLRPEALFNQKEEWQRFTGILDAAAAEAQRENLVFAFNSPVSQNQTEYCSENIGRACVVSVTGEVGPCVFTSPTLSQGNGQTERSPLLHIFQNSFESCQPLSFGNIAHESLTQIWNKQEYHEFRNLHDSCITQHDTAARLLPPACRSCHKRDA